MRSSAATAPARSAPTIVKPDHPIMKGFQSFTSWDETYVHTKHNEKDRTVLEVRARGRTEGAVDVGADARQGPRLLHRVGPRPADVGAPGFHNLLERGVRWACGQDPALAGRLRRQAEDDRDRRRTSKPFEYVEAKVPFYPPSKKWGVQADPITKMQKPLLGRGEPEAHRHAGGLRGEGVRHRGEARRQADRDELGRAGPAVGVDHGGLPERAAAARARAATASWSARTPTATACATR